VSKFGLRELTKDFTQFLFKDCLLPVTLRAYVGSAEKRAGHISRTSGGNSPATYRQTAGKTYAPLRGLWSNRVVSCAGLCNASSYDKSGPVRNGRTESSMRGCRLQGLWEHRSREHDCDRSESSRKSRTGRGKDGSGSSYREAVTIGEGGTERNGIICPRQNSQSQPHQRHPRELELDSVPTWTILPRSLIRRETLA